MLVVVATVVASKLYGVNATITIFGVYCIILVLYCIILVLYRILYCICFVLYCIVFVLYWIVFVCIVFHCVVAFPCQFKVVVGGLRGQERGLHPREHGPHLRHQTLCRRGGGLMGGGRGRRWGGC